MSSLDALSRVYRGSVAFGRGSLDTRTYSAQAHPGQLYGLGFSVYLSDIAGILPGGLAWVGALEQALGVIAGCGKIGAFTSPRGEGLPCHFDAEDVISVQLSGIKLFEVARVEGLPYPVGRQFGPRMLPGEELYAQVSQGFPKPDGLSFERIRMEPGSVLFLPRGTWHRTYAESDSFSISVGLRAPPALDHLLHQLRHILLQDPQWRRPLYGATQEGERRDQALARMEDLLHKLPNLLEHLNAADILSVGRPGSGVTAPGAVRFQRVPMSTLRWEPENRLLRLTVTAWDQDWIERTTLRTNVPGYLQDLLQWLSAAEAAFTLAQLRASFASVAENDLAQLLDLLTKAGSLRRLSFPLLTRA